MGVEESIGKKFPGDKILTSVRARIGKIRYSTYLRCGGSKIPTGFDMGFGICYGTLTVTDKHFVFVPSARFLAFFFVPLYSFVWALLFMLVYTSSLPSELYAYAILAISAFTAVLGILMFRFWRWNFMYCSRDTLKEIDKQKKLLVFSGDMNYRLGFYFRRGTHEFKVKEGFDSMEAIVRRQLKK